MEREARSKREKREVGFAGKACCTDRTGPGRGEAEREGDVEVRLGAKGKRARGRVKEGGIGRGTRKRLRAGLKGRTVYTWVWPLGRSDGWTERDRDRGRGRETSRPGETCVYWKSFNGRLCKR